jgi:FkbM family methyltransferase
MDFNGFDWGNSSDWYRETIFKEIFQDKIYEKFFSVENGDVVVDLGASIGPFPYSIKTNNPSYIYCFEPGPEQLPTLENNLKGMNYTIIPKGISDNDDFDTFEIYGSINKEAVIESIKFTSFIKDYNISKIDFLKTDCEGGEYHVFNRENIWWIKNNIKKIVGEWHLETPKQKEQFREFRDIYLKLFPNHEIFSVNGIDIKWSLWNDDFIEYYKQVIIYINNK